MSQKIIIDGYNMLHLVTAYKQILENDLEAARERLIHDLMIYRSNKKDRVRFYTQYSTIPLFHNSMLH